MMLNISMQWYQYVLYFIIRFSQELSAIALLKWNTCTFPMSIHSLHNNIFQKVKAVVKFLFLYIVILKGIQNPKSLLVWFHSIDFCRLETSLKYQLSPVPTQRILHYQCLHFILFFKSKWRSQFEWSEQYFNPCGSHSSVVSSAPTILRPRVWIPSTPSMLFSICIIEIVSRK